MHCGSTGLLKWKRSTFAAGSRLASLSSMKALEATPIVVGRGIGISRSSGRLNTRIVVPLSFFLLAQRQRTCRLIEVIDALRPHRTAEVEAQYLCGWNEIGFIVVHEGAGGDADRGWTRH